MPKDIFRDRERAEEAVYFQQEDEKLIEKLRARARFSEIAAALAEKLQVSNPELLNQIMALGITLDTGAAFILAPLVQIAWMDGHVTEAEQEVVMRFAFDRGVEPGSTDHAQLREWLADRPPDALFEASLDAIRAGLSVLPRAEAEERVDRITRACEEVAKASGGLSRLLHLHSGMTHREKSALEIFRARLLSF
jgi:hypothetical protein